MSKPTAESRRGAGVAQPVQGWTVALTEDEYGNIEAVLDRGTQRIRCDVPSYLSDEEARQAIEDWATSFNLGESRTHPDD